MHNRPPCKDTLLRSSDSLDSGEGEGWLAVVAVDAIWALRRRVFIFSLKIF